MFRNHIAGFVMAAVLIAAGLVMSPFTAEAGEFHWGFKKATDGIPPDAGAELNTLLEKNGALYKGSPDKKIVYLTFDNGYEAGYTESILDTLKKEDISATFFLTGHYLNSADGLVKRMVKDGHTIGNHSYGHPNMAKMSPAEMEAEWKKFDDRLREVAGVKRTHYARPPEGIFNEQVLKTGNKLGYRHIFWSVAYIDWHRDKKQGGQYAYNELMKQLHPGAVILMHTVSPDNSNGLPDFIRDAKKQGYTFGTLDGLVEEAFMPDM
ncbi:polysaccharide deacetylase [Bhargavaea cecembensis]|uniref:Polysaccharide deacetylase n=1 Tax=Bhargavaea cecembensis TaxID=394098 RepID=A0A161SKB0_9BACL|nr:polysaccharide deacetylase family protein [Bhargavaea cecembensis]KZE37863.1 polysaccharide deacetylase [Bhargavaea cecembensis]